MKPGGYQPPAVNLRAAIARIANRFFELHLRGQFYTNRAVLSLHAHDFLLFVLREFVDFADVGVG